MPQLIYWTEGFVSLALVALALRELRHGWRHRAGEPEPKPRIRRAGFLVAARSVRRVT